MGLFGSKEDKLIRKEQHNAALEKVKKFKVSKNVDNLLFIDTDKKQFRLSGFLNSGIIYDFSEVIGFELVEDGNSITSGGLGRAAIGALTFGPAGAIVGAVTGRKKENKVIETFKIKINLDGNTPVIYIDLITKKTKSNSSAYKDAVLKADRLISTLESFTKQTAAIANTPSQEDEMIKFKRYLDEGIITKQEFDAKKKELLDL